MIVDTAEWHGGSGSQGRGMAASRSEQGNHQLQRTIEDRSGFWRKLHSQQLRRGSLP